MFGCPLESGQAMEVAAGKAVHVVIQKVDGPFIYSIPVVTSQGKEVQLELIALVLEGPVILLGHVLISFRMSYNRFVSVQCQGIKDLRHFNRRGKIGCLNQNVDAICICEKVLVVDFCQELLVHHMLHYYHLELLLTYKDQLLSD